MIDPQLLRDSPDVVRRSQTLRGEPVGLVDEAIAADAARRAAITAFEAVRAEQNAFGKTVAAAPKDEKAALVAQAQELAAQVKATQAAASEAEAAFAQTAGSIQNIVLDGVPGGGEDDFVTLREVGEKPSFAFEPRDHLELGELLDAIDMERGAKVSGARFYFLKGVGARLEIALMNLGLDRALEAGFTPLITPTLVRPDIMAGTGFLGAHADEIYHLPGRRPLPHGHQRGRARRVSQGRDPRCVGRPAALRRLVDVLPPRGRVRRQGHPRHHPGAPVPEARDVQLHRPRGCRGRARAAARACRRRCCNPSA